MTGSNVGLLVAFLSVIVLGLALIRLICSNHLELGLPIGAVLVVIAWYVLPPLANVEKYFFIAAGLAMPMMVFGFLIGLVGLVALVVQGFLHWKHRLERES